MQAQAHTVAGSSEAFIDRIEDHLLPLKYSGNRFHAQIIFAKDKCQHLLIPEGEKGLVVEFFFVN